MIQRIAIIGNAGSGKSTLAKKLHEITKLPIYHLDQYYWKSNWIECDPEEYKKIHDELCNKPEWIMDGMNLKLLQYRIEKADIIIFLDTPRFICLWRIITRTIANYGKVRSTSAPGCPERFDFKFLKWVWNFKKNYRPKILDLLNQYKNKKEIYIIKSKKDLDIFFKNLEINLS